MNTLDFLRRVLPTTGTYCGVALRGKGDKPRSKFFETIEQLVQFLHNVDRVGVTAYYAMSTFDKMEDQDGALVFARKAVAVHRARVLAIDIDVGKKQHSYPTREEAEADWLRVHKISGLPDPMVVDSGTGYHIYWVLKEELPYLAWKKLAEALKATMQGYGLVMDPTVTADGARILRPIGTTHHGASKTVSLMDDAEPVSFRDIVPHLKFQTAGSTSAAPAHVKKRVHSPLLDAININVDLPPARGDLIYDKCQAVRSLVDNAGQQSEPQWYMLMGLASYCERPEQTAVAWSEGHDGFSESASLRKMSQWKDTVTGPPTCKKFSDNDSSLCQGCPFFEKITTPAQLGVSRAEVAINADAPEAKEASQIPMPYGFKRTLQGIYITLDDIEEQVCDLDIYPVSYGYDGNLGYQVYRYRFKTRHEDWKPLVLRASLLQENNYDFMGAMGDKSSFVGTQKQGKLMSKFMRDYMGELKRVKSMSNIDSSMGWKQNHEQFLYGDTVYSKTPTGVAADKIITNTNQEATANSYTSSGSLTDWTSMTKLLETAKMPSHMLALGIGFSAPLYAFTGLKGITISLYGKTGAGKSLAQYWCQSIYGNPQRLHFSGKFTQNSLFARLGSTCHFPMTIDETTMMPDKDMGEFLYWVTQGRDKHRLSRTAEERDSKEWATPVLCSTNRSMQSIIDSVGMDSEAQGARLLEIEVASHPAFDKSSDVGRKIYEFLTMNHGLAGPTYIDHLVDMGPEAIKAMIVDRTKTFGTRYGIEFIGQERYWEQALVLIDIGLEIADSLGLIKFNRRACIEWAVAAIMSTRIAQLDSKIDCFDLLFEYFNEHAAEAVTVMNTTSNNSISLDHQRIPRADIRIRYQLYRATPTAYFSSGIAYIDRTHFRKWVLSKGGDWKQWTKQIEQAGADATPPSKRYYLGKDTPTKTGQMYAIGINLTHPRLVGILNETEVKNLTTAMSNLHLVK